MNQARKKQDEPVQLRLDFNGKMQLPELFEAYYDCRKNKRKTANALQFEMNHEDELIKLWREVNDGSYRIGRSIAFIVDRPVKREIFAADFRDRIIHHWIINKLNHLFEKEFINDSYSCRKGRGTLFGVKRLNRFIRACSNNYREDAYVLQLDIKGFFMSIDRDILYRRLEAFIQEKYFAGDRDLLLHLVHLVVMNDCTQGCHIKTPRSKWKDLPADKSLFGRKGRGLPIGNLTSQVFANFYLSIFDHFMKKSLGFLYYGRYVDDFFVVHKDRQLLKETVPLIRSYLQQELGLQLHPQKQRLVHIRQGVKFVGAFLLPQRIYIERRTKGNFYRLISRWNTVVRARTERPYLSREEQSYLLASVNSYLGFMRHYSTFKLRKRMLYRLSARIDRQLRPAGKYTRLVTK